MAGGFGAIWQKGSKGGTPPPNPCPPNPTPGGLEQEEKPKRLKATEKRNLHHAFPPLPIQSQRRKKKNPPLTPKEESKLTHEEKQETREPADEIKGAELASQSTHQGKEIPIKVEAKEELGKQGHLKSQSPTPGPAYLPT